MLVVIQFAHFLLRVIFPASPGDIYNIELDIYSLYVVTVIRVIPPVVKTDCA